MPKEIVTTLIVISLILLIISGFITSQTYNALYGLNAHNIESDTRTLHIVPGMSLMKVAELLRETKIIDRQEDFIFAAEFLNFDHRIQAGEYDLPYGISNSSLLSMIVNAGGAASLVTIPEGCTSRQIAGMLQTEIGIDSTSFMEAVYDTVHINKYGLLTPSFEGFLFPDSYNFHKDMSALQVIDLMVNRFFTVFHKCVDASPDEVNLSFTELVTLASIVEGEMSLLPEAPKISAIYQNRLRKNMRLQADPTIQYIIKKGPRRLYNGDLAIDSPYNTYLYSGLPPGPVCNPGRAALMAALNPAPDPYLYMVSKGDGSHAFNTKFSDHLRDKARLDSLRIVVSRERRK